MIVPRSGIADVSAVARHYDDLDDLYRSLWGTNLHHGYWMSGKESANEAADNLTRLLAREAAIKPADRVCDLGCGYGTAAVAWNREFGAAVTGITISEKQYRHALEASRGNHDVEFILGDALDSGLAAESFDAVLAVESSEHMPDKAKFFAEARRLLRPGGRCVVVAWLSRDRPGSWESKHLLEPICSEGRLPSMGSAQEYRTILEQAGFRDVEWSDLTERVKKTWTICALRLIQRCIADGGLRRRLWDARFINRVFAKTIFRIWLAYAIGAMRYGLFSSQKSGRCRRSPATS